MNKNDNSMYMQYFPLIYILLCHFNNRKGTEIVIKETILLNIYLCIILPIMYNITKQEREIKQ